MNELVIGLLSHSWAKCIHYRESFIERRTLHMYHHPFAFGTDQHTRIFPGGPGFPSFPGFPGFPGGGGSGFTPSPPPIGQGGTGQSQDGPPSSPPPSFTPQMQQQQQFSGGGASVFAVDPGAIHGCLRRYTFIWLENGNSFWFYPTFVGRTSVAGWRWRNFRWTYYGTDLRRISSFRCF